MSGFGAPAHERNRSKPPDANVSTWLMNNRRNSILVSVPGKQRTNKLIYFNVSTDVKCLLKYQLFAEIIPFPSRRFSSH